MKLLLQLLALILNRLPKTEWKPIPLCEVYGRYGLDAPNLVGHATAPSMTTGSASSITASSFTMGGTISSTGGENASVRGFCYVIGSGGTPTTSNSVVNQSGSYSTGSYSLPISGLAAGTTYSVRAYATNSAGTGYGTTVNVTTVDIGPPTVSTGTPSNIANTNLNMANNRIISTGGTNATVRGVCYVEGSGGTPTTADNVASSTGSYGASTFGQFVTGLSQGTTYSFRAFATNVNGTGYGSVVEGTTSGVPIRPLSETLTDDFEDGVIDTAKWYETGGTGVTRVETGGEIVITPVTTGSYGGIVSSGKYNLTGSSAYIDVTGVTTASNAAAECQFILDIDGSSRLLIGKAGTGMVYRYAVGGTNNDTYGSYDANTMKYWQIAESGGNILWQTSPDSVTWTTRRTVATPITITNLMIVIQAGMYASVASPGSFKVANLNLSGIVSGGLAVKFWNGSSFVEKPVKIWNGSSQVEKPLKAWNGTEWL